MLSVLLKILTVIGVCLLFFLGLILFILLIILFVPITYKINAVFNQTGKSINAKIHWLFGLLRFRIQYEKEIVWTLKFLWFDLTGKLQKKAASIPDQMAKSSVQEEAVTKQESVPDGIHTGETVAGGTVADQIIHTEPVSDESDPEQVSHKGISDKINNIIVKIQSMLSKLQDLMKKTDYYIGVLQEDDTKDLLSCCFGAIGKVLKSIRPRKLQLNLIMGFEGPDTTGKAYGLLCMLYPYYGNNIHVTPDFEKKILNGSLHAGGHVFGFVFAWNALKILLNKKLYRVIHKLKNGGKHKNGG